MKKIRSALLTAAAILTMLAAFCAMHRLEQKNKNAEEQIELTQSDAEAALQALYRSGTDVELENSGKSEISGASVISENSEIDVEAVSSENSENDGESDTSEEAGEPETGGESDTSEEAGEPETGGESDTFEEAGEPETGRGSDTSEEDGISEGSETEALSSIQISNGVDIPAIWVGDSRTVGMRKAVGTDSGDIFIAASGEGYDWFAETGEPQLKTVLAKNPERPVIFNLGVNDDENLDNYLRVYRSLQQEYPDTVFWFLSVNPVDPERCSAITNEEIEYFNEKLEEAFPGQYLDSYSRMDGTETIDGIHYSKEQYRWIYVFVKEALAGQTQQVLAAQTQQVLAAQTQ